MTCYVDDMFEYPIGKFRGMKMSHMIADTDDELHDMAEEIGVPRKWYQGDHYDIAMSKRALAIKEGAVAITYAALGRMFFIRRKTGILPSPESSAAMLSRLTEIMRLV